MQRALRIAVVAFFICVSTFAASKASRDFWHELMLGNAEFVKGHLVYAHLKEQRDDHREHQYPPVTVLSCADSRVPPELIFDHSIGDLFVVRVAGNVTDQYPLASVEYAVMKGYTKLIVVMGHEDCGAVDAAINGGLPPTRKNINLNALIKRIKDNIGDQKDPKAATELNAQMSAKYLTDHSRIIRDAVCSNKTRLQIKPAYYDFDGKVTELDPLPGTPSYPCR